MVEIREDGHGCWVALCPYHEKDIPKSAGFQWDMDRRVWWTGSAAVRDSLRRTLDEPPPEIDYDEWSDQWPALIKFGPLPGSKKPVWHAITSYVEREIPKSAGFRWAADAKAWYTDNPRAVRHFIDIHPRGRNDKNARAKLVGGVDLNQDRIALSRATESDVDVPAPAGLSYRPFQRAGIVYARQGANVIFGDEMGLGKTIQAIGVANDDPSLKKILICCPKSLKLNWYRELRTWLVRPLMLGLAESDSCPAQHCDVLIINYDIVARHEEKLRAQAWDFIICDEAQLLKNPKAARTIAILGRARTKEDPEAPAIPARRRAFLTGTPIPNYVIELWGIVRTCGVVNSFGRFFTRYCDGNAKGAANLDELQLLLRSTVMVRRLKQDVLKDLPAKQRQVIELDASGNIKTAIAREVDAGNTWERVTAELAVAKEMMKVDAAYADDVARLRDAAAIALEEMSKLRKAVAIMAAPTVAEYVSDMLEEAGKVVLFAHHHDVIDLYRAHFDSSGIRYVVVTGKTSAQDRQRAVDEFQGDAECQVFVGNILAAGVGITLAAASTVVFGELDWVPGNMSQAEDRCHRIGQHDVVNVFHVVVNGSIQARMAKKLIEKQVVIDRALDDKGAQMPEASAVSDAAETGWHEVATATVTPSRLDEWAKELSADDVAAVHAKLKLLAAMDADHASQVNGVGFSKVDVAIGHKLAKLYQLTPRQAALGSILVNKYRRQLA